MNHVDQSQVIHLADRSRAGLMERCRQRALGMMADQGHDPRGYEVWQHRGKDRGYERVGFLPCIPARSSSGIFDLRPGDLTWGEIDGKRVILASWSICPGDWACVPGFRQVDGATPPMDEHARKFDQLTALGADRFTALETIIKDALGGR